MARNRRTITAAKRKALPPNSFAYPQQRKYPIDTKARARNALARSAQTNTSGTYSHVAKAVRRKWGNQIPTVGPTKGTTTRPGPRKSGHRH